MMRYIGRYNVLYNVYLDRFNVMYRVVVMHSIYVYGEIKQKYYVIYRVDMM